MPVLAYLLAITTLIVSVGRLGDLTGRRRLLLAGITVFTIASVVCGLAPTLGVLVAARAVQGLGAAVMMALTMAFASEAVPREMTGSAMGVLGTMSAVGTALGPSLGGLLIAGFGWRAIFLVNIPLGVAALVFTSRFLPFDRPRSKADGARFDSVGTFVLALTLAAYALAMATGSGSFGALNLALLLVSAVGVGVFVLAETRRAAPLPRMSMFRNQVLSAGFVMSAMVTTVVMATLVVGPFYLSGALGLDAVRVGLVMSTGPIVAALAGAPAGRFVDRLGAQRVGIVGLTGMGAGSALLAMLPTSLGLPGYIAPLIVITGGYATFQAANNTAVMRESGPEQRGVTAGVLNLSRNLALITGASVMGAVFSWGAGTTDVVTAAPGDIAAGLRVTLAVAAVFISIALVVALRSGGKRGRSAVQADDAAPPSRAG